jgi:3-polyprenyl-4-hydroxybenzoate decarboxylase
MNFPEIVDIALPAEGVCHNLVFVSIKKTGERGGGAGRDEAARVGNRAGGGLRQSQPIRATVPPGNGAFAG